MNRDLAGVLDDFLNDYGMFYNFKKYIEDAGYYLSDFNLTDDD